MKLFFKILVLIALGLSLFYYAGTLTEKSFHYDNFMDNLANYFASPIYALNEYIKEPGDFFSQSSLFGCYTLSGLYSFLKKLGFKIADNIIVLEYISCGDYLTNIYTPLRRYLQDFGVFGMSAIMAFLGFFYTKLLARCKKPSASDFDFIIVGFFCFPLIYISIEERFFMDVIITRSVHSLFFLYILYLIVIKRMTRKN